MEWVTALHHGVAPDQDPRQPPQMCGRPRQVFARVCVPPDYYDVFSLPNVLSREYSRVSHSTCMGQPTPLSESQLITSRHQFISVPLHSLYKFYDFPNMQHSTIFSSIPGTWNNLFS